MGRVRGNRWVAAAEEVGEMFCPACGNAADQGSGYCAVCGRPLPAVAPGGPGVAPTVAVAPAPPSAPVRAPTAAAPTPVTTIEVRRLGIGDLIALAGTLVLFVSLFMPWYSIQVAFASLPDTRLLSISAIGDGAGGWRFLIFAVSLIVMVYLFIRTTISRPTRRTPLPHWQLLTALCALNVLLTVLAFFVKPGDGTTVSGLSFGWDYGAFLGLSAAVLALIGALIRRADPELRDPGVPYTSHREAVGFAQVPPVQPYGASAPAAVAVAGTPLTASPPAGAGVTPASAAGASLATSPPNTTSASTVPAPIAAAPTAPAPTVSAPAAPAYAPPPEPRPARTGSRSLIHHHHR